jgi:hypothetical protein
MTDVYRLHLDNAFVRLMWQYRCGQDADGRRSTGRDARRNDHADTQQLHGGVAGMQSISTCVAQRKAKSAERHASLPEWHLSPESAPIVVEPASASAGDQFKRTAPVLKAVNELRRAACHARDASRVPILVSTGSLHVDEHLMAIPALAGSGMARSSMKAVGTALTLIKRTREMLPMPERPAPTLGTAVLRCSPQVRSDVSDPFPFAISGDTIRIPSRRVLVQPIHNLQAHGHAVLHPPTFKPPAGVALRARPPSHRPARAPPTLPSPTSF